LGIVRVAISRHYYSSNPRCLSAAARIEPIGRPPCGWPCYCPVGSTQAVGFGRVEDQSIELYDVPRFVNAVHVGNWLRAAAVAPLHSWFWPEIYHYSVTELSPVT
jgi:hypothetical protein